MSNSFDSIDPVSMLRPRRKITGMSAILLPFLDGTSSDFANVDWDTFDAHVLRTTNAGLIPAINMDTGYANLISKEIRQEVLKRTESLVDGGQFVSGAFVADKQGDEFSFDAYKSAIEEIQSYHGTPVIFQSFGLTAGDESAIVERYEQIAKIAPEFYAFELGTMFLPFGKIYSLETYQKIMEITECKGAKHSSLSRELEWQRLQLRDQHRPDFSVMTGNDLAIDMVMYGSDYLLGLSTFAPDLFAVRDMCWEVGDTRFYELNDQLQYLGFFAFRETTPAYKHNAAQFLHLRGWCQSNATHVNSAKRPESDVEVLRELAERMGILD